MRGQLKRVAGWLDHDDECRIHQRVLYGKPVLLILTCAEELDAQLIVAGSHGRSFLGQVLRRDGRVARSRCPSLGSGTPHAAAFQGLDLAPHENGAAQSRQRLPLER
jgi:hypothetical protein